MRFCSLNLKNYFFVVTLRKGRFGEYEKTEPTCERNSKTQRHRRDRNGRFINQRTTVSTVHSDDILLTSLMLTNSPHQAFC